MYSNKKYEILVYLLFFMFLIHLPEIFECFYSFHSECRPKRYCITLQPQQWKFNREHQKSCRKQIPQNSSGISFEKWVQRLFDAFLFSFFVLSFNGKWYLLCVCVFFFLSSKNKFSRKRECYLSGSLNIWPIFFAWHLLVYALRHFNLYGLWFILQNPSILQECFA